MAKVNLGLKHGDHDTTQREGGGALPDGHFRFEVDELQVKDHYDGRKGYKLDAVLEVIEPEGFKGRKMFLDFGVEDPNPHHPDAETWARQDFAKFLKAIDFPEDKEFDDTDDAIGRSGIARYGLDRKRSDKQNKRYGKVWGYVYPEDESEWFEKNDLGPSDRQEEWFPAKQTPAGGGREERGSRDRDRDRGRDRGEREERGSRDRGRDDRGGRGERDDSRGRDRDRGSRDSRGDEGDDIPFDGNREGGDEDRPQRGGGASPWNRGRR